MDRVLKTCLSPALDDNYLSKNNASTQVLYLNKKILSDFFQNENCCNDRNLHRRPPSRNQRHQQTRPTSALSHRPNRQHPRHDTPLAQQHCANRLKTPKQKTF
jgi:hypothetical protein